jgi:hypothetical protein
MQRGQADKFRYIGRIRTAGRIGGHMTAVQYMQPWCLRRAGKTEISREQRLRPPL